MTQENPLISNQNSSVSSSSTQPRNWCQWLLMYSALPVALVVFTQTAVTLFFSYSLGVSPNKVAESKENQSILSENMDCINSPENLQRFARPVLMGDGAKVGAALCPTGDLALYVQSPKSPKGTYRFISGRILLGNDKTAQQNVLMNALINIVEPAAIAMPAPILGVSSVGDRQNLNPEEQLAQAPSVTKVICSKIENNRLIRLIQYSDGNCVREVVDANTGNVLDSISGASCSGGCS